MQDGRERSPTPLASALASAAASRASQASAQPPPPQAFASPLSKPPISASRPPAGSPAVPNERTYHVIPERAPPPPVQYAALPRPKPPRPASAPTSSLQKALQKLSADKAAPPPPAPAATARPLAPPDFGRNRSFTKDFSASGPFKDTSLDAASKAAKLAQTEKERLKKESEKLAKAKAEAEERAKAAAEEARVKMEAAAERARVKKEAAAEREKKQKLAAATIIQRNARRWLARRRRGRELAERRAEGARELAAVVVQRNFRAFLARVRAYGLLRLEVATRNGAAELLAAWWRGRFATAAFARARAAQRAPLLAASATLIQAAWRAARGRTAARNLIAGRLDQWAVVIQASWRARTARGLAVRLLERRAAEAEAGPALDVRQLSGRASAAGLPSAVSSMASDILRSALAGAPPHSRAPSSAAGPSRPTSAQRPDSAQRPLSAQRPPSAQRPASARSNLSAAPQPEAPVSARAARAPAAPSAPAAPAPPMVLRVTPSSRAGSRAPSQAGSGASSLKRDIATVPLDVKPPVVNVGGQERVAQPFVFSPAPVPS